MRKIEFMLTTFSQEGYKKYYSQAFRLIEAKASVQIDRDYKGQSMGTDRNFT